MEGKKISFGFMKTKKVDKPVVEEKKQYIDCLEEKSIKVVGGEEIQEKAPLIIPMKPNTLVTAERLKQIAEEVELAVQEPDVKEEPKSLVKEEIIQNETIEQMAVRELLQDAKKTVKVEGPALTVPVPSQPVIDGQKESTLEDYDSVPIQDFGLAMLRGMGWTPGKEQTKHKEIAVRPKGLGLGADKIIKPKQGKDNTSKNNQDDAELMIMKNAFVRINTGKYSGCYGKVVSLDEDNGRVMVDLAVKKETVSISEFMMHPVTKSEYEKMSKVINVEKYEEYKRKETPQNSQKSSSHADDSRLSKRDSSKPNDVTDKSDNTREHSSNGRHKDKHRHSSSSEEDSRRRREDRRRYSSDDSLSPSDTDRRRKRKEDRRKHSNSSESESSDSEDRRRSRKNKKHSKEQRRDIDKKRKGKKKKRDRDRSPNYRKHRK